MMKITKQLLKEMIEEEVEAVLDEIAKGPKEADAEVLKDKSLFLQFVALAEKQGYKLDHSGKKLAMLPGGGYQYKLSRSYQVDLDNDGENEYPLQNVEVDLVLETTHKVKS